MSDNQQSNTSIDHRRPYGFWTVTFLVVANMVGAGVFTTSGFTLESLGSPRLVVLAWVVGGVIAFAGAASYGQLTRAIPGSGGEFLFLSRALHPSIGFVAGWISFIAGFSGAIAFAASAFESYVMPESSRPTWLPEDTVAILAIFIAGIIHGVRVRGGALIQNIAVILKLALLAGFLVIATIRMPHDIWQGGAIANDAPAGSALWIAFATSLVWISLSYSGFNAAVYVAGETKNARHSVPLALLVGTFVVTTLYVLLNAIFVYAPPLESVAGAADVAAVAAAWLGGDLFETAVRWLIALALFTSVSSMVMVAPRVYAKMADDGMFPRLFKCSGEAPRFAIALQLFVASAFVLASSLRELLSYLGLTLSLTAAVSVSCLFRKTVRNKLQPSPSIIAPLVYIMATLTTCTIMVVSNPWQLLGTAGTCATGLIAYFFLAKTRHGRS